MLVSHTEPKEFMSASNVKVNIALNKCLCVGGERRNNIMISDLCSMINTSSSLRGNIVLAFSFMAIFSKSTVCVTGLLWESVYLHVFVEA